MAYTDSTKAEQYKYEYVANYLDVTPQYVYEVVQGIPNNSNDPVVIAIEENWEYINDYMYKELIIPATTMVVKGVVTTLEASVIELTHNEILSRMVNHTFELLDEYDHNLVYVPANAMASKLCVRRQGKVYWVGKPVEGYEELKPEMFIYGGGLFHPHCRHNMNPWFPGDVIPPPPNTDEALAMYDINQKWKYLKRNKKKYKNRLDEAKLSGLESSKKYLKDQTKYKEWDKRLRTFNAKYKGIKNDYQK